MTLPSKTTAGVLVAGAALLVGIGWFRHGQTPVLAGGPTTTPSPSAQEEARPSPAVPTFDVARLFGTWRPVLTPEAKRDLLAKLGPYAADPEAQASMNDAQQKLEARSIVIDASAVTTTAPGQPPTRQPYRIARRRRDGVDVRVNASDAGPAGVLALRLGSNDQLVMSLAGKPEGPQMVLRRESAPAQ